MKFTKIAFASALALAFGQAQALHDGGVAHCDACHTMHNSSAGGGEGLAHGIPGAPAAPTMTTNGTENPYLLQGATASETCFNCHGVTTPGSYHVLDGNAAPTMATLNFTPGGDFAFLKAATGGDERKGHNVASVAFGINPDSRPIPPGYTGTWNGAGFSCVSCHDPHGQSRYTGNDTLSRPTTGNALLPIRGSGSTSVDAFDLVAGTTIGAYRILGGNGWVSRGGGVQFDVAVSPPIAVAPSTYNKSETAFAVGAAGATGQTVVAYVTGMSEWCKTCHPAMHKDAALGFGNNLKHPAGANAKLPQVIVDNYNKYVKTGDWSGTKAYDAFVPVELGGTRMVEGAKRVDITGTADITVGTTSNVMCLSCHRAHASGYDSMMRWDYGATFTMTATPGAPLIKYAGQYGRNQAYGAYQRGLCNKCHAKD